MRGKTKLYAGVGIRGRDPASFPTRVVFACLSTQSRVQVCPEGPAMSSLDRIWLFPHSLAPISTLFSPESCRSKQGKSSTTTPSLSDILAVSSGRDNGTVWYL